jgi:hypothetical protein
MCLTDGWLSAARSGSPTLAVAAIAAALASRHALHDPFWQDEVASARILQQPSIGAVLHRVVQTESTPPLWYLLAWATHHAGLSIVDVRFVSVAAMSLTAAIVFVLARRQVGTALALVAGSLVAFGCQFAAHAHELRA